MPRIRTTSGHRHIAASRTAVRDVGWAQGPPRDNDWRLGVDEAPLALAASKWSVGLYRPGSIAMKFIVILGDPMNGGIAVGPFENLEAATAYMEAHKDEPTYSYPLTEVNE